MRAMEVWVAPVMASTSLAALGAGLALAGLMALLAWLGPQANEWLRFLDVGGGPAWRPEWALEMLGLGAGLGFIGSLLAVRRFLRV